MSAGTLAAQQARPPELSAPAEPGSELTVYLLTFGIGGRVWERFGHNAIRIRDARSGTDLAYDWGRFDFAQANFLSNFARGSMRYWMDSANAPATMAFYARQGRKVWVQELEVAPAARLALRDFLAWNIQEANKYYDYDYYRDNCSTRVRDAVDKALGGAIGRWADRPSGVTWRDDTRRLNQHNVWLRSGLMTALGRPVDREMTHWEQMFLPVRLRELMDSVSVVAADGATRPAVRSQFVYAEGGRFAEPATAADWTFPYLAAGVVLGGLLLGLGRGSTRRGARGAFIALATLWCLLGGLVGLVVAWLWAFSTHAVAHRNENVLLFNALVLALAVVLPSAVRRRAWALKPARRLALAVAALAALALVLKLLPGSQGNLDLIAFVLPVHAGVALGLSSRPDA